MEKLFAISYKLRYYETSDWGTEYIKARNKDQALSSFMRSRKIRSNKFKSVNEWHWEEGVWSAEFWNITEVKEVQCPHCNGTGIIHT